jgi:hypothetical protein
MTVPQLEQQINDMMKSSTGTVSKTVDSHLGHLGVDIFTLRFKYEPVEEVCQ